MVDNIPITKFLEECRAQAWEIYANMDATHKGVLFFDNGKLFFNPKEEDFLNDEEEIYMVDIIALL